MADDPGDLEDEIVKDPYFSIEETRRHFVLEAAAPYVSDEMTEYELFRRLANMTKWLETGETPPKPEEKKSKFKVVGGDDGKQS